MTFERINLPGFEAYGAVRGPWQFMVIGDGGKWTASYRLRDPKSGVSASSTIMGPFDSFDDCTDAAEQKARELRGLS